MGRPIKYKRNRKHKNTMALLLMVLFVIAVIGALVVSGIAIAKFVQSRGQDPEPQNSETAPGSETVTGSDDTSADAQSAEQTTETEPPVVTEEETVAIEYPEGITPTEGYLGLFFDPTGMTEAQLRAAVSDAKDKGYTTAVFLAKKEDGMLGYASRTELASTYGAVPKDTLSAAKIIAIFHESDMYVCARLCGFRDNTAAGADTEIALHKTGGIRWSDGSSRWLSVYSAGACDYICALASELDRAGADEVSVAHFGLPQTNETALIDYGGTDHQAAVTAFVAKLYEGLSHAQLTLEETGSAWNASPSEVSGIDADALSQYCAAFVADIREETVTANLRTFAGKYPSRLLCNDSKSFTDVFKAYTLTGKYGS